MSFIPIAVGDSVTLRKPHACGGSTWSVTRVGADIGLLCLGCGRRVILEREEFERRMRRVEQAREAAPSVGTGAA